MSHSKSLLPALLFGCALALPAQADVDAGIAALNTGDAAAAIGHFEADLLAPDTMFEAHWRTGQALVMSGRSKDALDYLEKAIEMQENHADAQYWWGAANGEVAAAASIFSAPGYAKKCKRAFERTLELDPTHLDAFEGLISFHLQAPGMVGGDKEEAVNLANRMAEIDPARGMGQLANVYLVLERPDDALATFEQAITDHPDRAALYLQRGLTLRAQERFDAAAADFRTLAAFTTDESLKPGELEMLVAMGRYFLGSIASLSGQHLADGKAALEAYLEAALFDEDWREGYALYYLASIHLHEGNKTEASALVEKADEIDGPKDLRKRLKQLKKEIRKA